MTYGELQLQALERAFAALGEVDGDQEAAAMKITIGKKIVVLKEEKERWCGPS